MSYRHWLGLAAIALVSFGAWSAFRHERAGTPTAVPQSLLPKAEVENTASPGARKLATKSKPVEQPLDATCGPEFRLAADGSCIPIDPATGDTYTPARLEEFDAIRRSSYVGRHNLLVPRAMTPAETKSRRELFAKANELGKKIDEGQATPEEIEDYFGFRAKVRAYREQLLTFEHARAGGRVSAGDPVLDREELKNPEILARYDELERAMREEYAQKEEALRRVSLREP